MRIPSIVTFPDEFAAREGPVSDVAGPGGAAVGGPLDLLGTAIRPTIEFRVDGRRVKLFEIAGMTAGEAAFDGQPGPPTLTRVEIAGPHQVTGVSETPSRRRIFLCKPASAAEEEPCATRILSTIVRRAFRRDITDVGPAAVPRRRTKRRAASAASRNRSRLLSATCCSRRTSCSGSNLTLRMLVPASVHPVSAFELASRLSFFLWSSIPDDALLDTAASGKLLDAKVLDSTVRRMLDDPRAVALADNFAAQWLGLRALGDIEPDKQTYPEFDTALASRISTPRPACLFAV